MFSCTVSCVLNLLFHCTYAVQVWQGVARAVSMDLLHVGETVQDTWTKSYALQTSTAS